MAGWTQTDIDKMKAAIASNVLVIKHGETLTHFRTMKEMKTALEMMQAEVSKKPTRSIASFSRGLR